MISLLIGKDLTPALLNQKVKPIYKLKGQRIAWHEIVYGMAWNGVTRYGMPWYGIEWYGMVLYGIV